MTRVAVATGGALAALRAGAPGGVEVLDAHARGAVERAGFAVVGWAEEGVLARLGDAPGLEVVQVMSAGTEWVEPHVPPGVTLCNARGARDAPVAEWVVGALLGASSGLLDAARRPRWEHFAPAELGGWTIVVLGMGSIGGAVRDRLAPFGARVVGVASRARADAHGVEALPDLLPAADALVVLLPLTAATRGLVDADLLRRLPDAALVVNAGRGAVIDTGALLAEVASGRLRAVLDVTDPEPLPADHPLWRASGTLAVTPHVAGDSVEADDRAIAHAVAQVARWAAGEPLHAVVRRG